jgi:hypothetical protein
MNRFARRISAAVVTTVALLWVTAASASAVRVPLDQDVAPYPTGVPVDLTSATAAVPVDTTPWLLVAAILAVLVAGFALVARLSDHGNQGPVSAN